MLVKGEEIAGTEIEQHDMLCCFGLAAPIAFPYLPMPTQLPDAIMMQVQERKPRLHGLAVGQQPDLIYKNALFHVFSLL